MRAPRLWWVPLLLLFAAAFDLVPASRDLVDFFAPMRSHTAAALGAGEVPWLNLANGCGEAWFANPETGVLYPVHWLHVLLPVGWGLAAEVALHLALLALGCGLLARRWGASPWARTTVEVTAVAAGPVLATVGVVNNLETLAWLPWVVLAAGGRGRSAVVWTALATAAAWLAGEPQIWALSVVVAVSCARRPWRAVAGASLGALLVAVQLVPFVVWVLQGDRGPRAARAALEGAVSPLAWWGLVVPGMPQAVAEQMVYAASLFLGAPLLVALLVGCRARRAPWVVGAVMAGLATLPTVGGGTLYSALTAGLVRYPSRFAVVAAVVVLPLVGPGVDRWMAGRGRSLALVVAALTLLGCAVLPGSRHWVLAGVPAVLCALAAGLPPAWRATKPLRGAAVGAGLVALVAAGVPLLGLGPAATFGWPDPVWPEARGSDRLYTPPATPEMRPWFARGPLSRRLWPVGYLNLADGLTLTRTFAPVGHRQLATHLDEADRGPSHRWWLDTLAARWLVLPTGVLPEATERVGQRGGLWLLQNLRAAGVVTLAAAPPSPARPFRGCGGRLGLRRRPDGLDVVVDSDRGGCLWVSVAPLAGWRWRLDADRVELESGPGILQWVEVAAGRHRLVGRYRPPLLPVAAVVSGLALLATGALLCSRWRSRSAGGEPAAGDGRRPES